MMLPPPRDNQFLFLDMNAFFASCEQHRQPELRGQPVAVTPTLCDSGCVIAASYEAKKLGVTTGCRVGEARQRIPHLRVVKADPRYYVAIHDNIHQFLLEEVTPHPLKVSIDEFAIPLTPTEHQTPYANDLALFIKTRLEQLSSPALRCSIGIGPNLFLAKLGTEIQKPNGLVFIQLHTLPNAYQTLKLRDIPGINWGMQYRLNSLGIQSPLDFYHAPRQLLHNALGITGDAWWYNLHGYKVDVHESETKSISHSHVISPRFRTKTEARAVLYKLWIKVAERARDKHFAIGEVAVLVRGKNARWHHTVATRPTQNVFTLFGAIAAAYDRELPHYFAPHQIVVVAYNFSSPRAMPLGLFPEDTQKITQLFTSVDSINDRYGRWTIQPASLLRVSDSAPNRISFRTPDFEMDT